MARSLLLFAISVKHTEYLEMLSVTDVFLGNTKNKQDRIFVLTKYKGYEDETDFSSLFP